MRQPDKGVTCAPINTIRVIIVDDHEMVRQGLRSMLKTLPDIEVIGEAPDGRTGVRLAAELLPDIVVMDIAMPDLNGVDATAKILAGGNGIKVIALSGRSDAHSVKDMLGAGASAFISKESAFKELSEAIRSVIAGRVYISPGIQSGNGELPDGNGNGKTTGLSPRERETLQLMAEGRSTKEIAMDLGVSVKTVETYRRNIQEKLAIFSVAELTKYAIREGITSMD